MELGQLCDSHISDKVEYRLYDVMGCKQSNLDPTALSAKNALLSVVLRSVVRDKVE